VRQRAFAAELAEQAAAGGQQALQALRRQPCAMLGGDELAHPVRFQRGEFADPLRLHPGGELGEVAAVAVHGVRRGLPLAGEAGQPGLDLLRGRAHGLK